MAEVRKRWGDEETAAEKVKRRRLEWLGHLARMPEHRLPKSALFGWMPQPRPRCGPRKRWRDVVRRDFADIDVEESEWYEKARTSRAGWKGLCNAGMEDYRLAMVPHISTAVRDVVCENCCRTFRRESDKKRHKCLSERQKPVSQQQGAIQCLHCRRWFKSKGGLAVLLQM